MKEKTPTFVPAKTNKTTGMHKNYNYQRKRLFLPEYGRHIHEMVDHLSTIEEREVRNRQAAAVIAVMANINPMLRDSTDFDQKLWDHLFIISDFKLDVDSPYPIPSRETLEPVPERLSYPTKQIERKHYGKYLLQMIRSLHEVDNKEGVGETVENIARFMRTKSYEYNQEHPNNETIIRDIREISGNRIEVDEETLSNLKNDYKPYLPPRLKKGNQPNRNGKNRNNRNNPGKRYGKPKNLSYLGNR